MKVLITQPQGKERLINAFEEAGAEVVSKFEPFNSNIRLIVPTVDEEMWFFSRAREWFKEKGVTVAVSPEFAVSMCRDKAEFYRFCRRHGFDVPHTMQEEVIAKPRFGKGSRGQIRLDRSYILQEFIQWPEYSIDYFKLGDCLSVIPRRRENVVYGESQKGTPFMDRRLIREAKNLGEQLGLEYHNVLQCFYDGNHIKWIEVNTRYGGGSWLTFQMFNSPKFLLESLT